LKISDVCIRRPVFATVMSLALVLVGIVAYDRLTVREYPNTDSPVVNVETTYAGASAEIIETQVTQVLEDSLAGIEGIDFMTSISRQEQSQITVTFNLDRDPGVAAADVRDRVSRVRGDLPDAIEEPIIEKVEADAQAVIWLAFSSDRHSSMEITDYADRYVRDRLQNLSGVAEVRLWGERLYSMRIRLDPERMAAYGVTVQDVENALRRQNIEVPSGRIESEAREFTVLSQTDLRTAEQFNDLIIRASDGYFVRLADIGAAGIDAREERMMVRYNGAVAIALGVVKQATANPLDVSRAVRSVLPEITDSLPEGMEVAVASDDSLYIEESIRNVWKTIAEAIVLVTLIIFVFLRSLRATLIPFVTIPVALIGAFALMFALGFSINTLTLLALVLAITDGGGVPGQPRNRIRGDRHGDHAGGRLRAHRLHDRYHREAVHRVRLGAGRRRSGLRLRCPDPVADDVLAPAPAPDRARCRLPCDRARTQRGDGRLPKIAGRRAACAAAHRHHRPRRGGGQLRALPGTQRRTGSL
jgi:multidrug efflux pump